MTDKKIEQILKKIPNSPGVYKMKNSSDKILYVGKAKSLSNRVKSYFRKQKDMPIRTQKLVEQIVDIEWIEVGSDLEALLLETNLIKEYLPKYNVLMKDDKNFVYIKITKEDFPRIEIVRKVLKDGAKYYGPKTAAHKVEKILNVLQKIFNYRSCSLGINWVNIGEVKISNKTIAYPCLDYHIKRCEGPCIAKVSPEEYRKNISQIERFIEGKTAEIEAALNEKMLFYANQKNFEMAAKTRDKLNAIKDLSERQIISSPEHNNSDVISFVIDNEKAYFNLFMVREGHLINQENFILDAPGFQKDDEANATEILESFLFEYYSKALQFPGEILIPLELEEDTFFSKWIENLSNSKIKIFIPQRGNKHALLDLAMKNAESFRKQHIVKWELSSNDDTVALAELSKHLGLEKNPFRIECYDISHLSGTNTVASMVVFEKGRSKSSDYRKFRIRNLNEGEIDDFKSMEEVIFRRLLYLSKSYSKFTFKKTKKSDTEFEAFLNKKSIAKMNVESSKAGIFITEFEFPEKYKNKEIEKLFLRYVMEKKKVKRAYISTKEKSDYLENLGFEIVKKIPDEFAKHIDGEYLWAFDKLKLNDSSFLSKPDLIVIDGGKGQLSSAINARNELNLKIPIISLAKREEEVFVDASTYPLNINKDSQSVFLLRRIRDEAHRFAITFQKSSRKETDQSSVLDEIDGLGHKTKMKLLNKFSSVEIIKSAGLDDIAALTGMEMAKKIQLHLTK